MADFDDLIVHGHVPFGVSWLLLYFCLQCFDAVGWAAGRAPGL